MVDGFVRSGQLLVRQNTSLNNQKPLTKYRTNNHKPKTNNHQLLLPVKFSHLRAFAVAAAGAYLFPFMECSLAAPSASDVAASFVVFSKTGGSFTHCVIILVSRVYKCL